jgi:multiple sugar transport system permease protein
MVVPYLLVFVVFVLYPVGYGCGWRAIRQLREAVRRPDLLPLRDQHGRVPGRGINIKMLVALVLSGFFVHLALVDQDALGDVHPAVGDAVHSHHPVVPLHAEPGVGRDQHAPSSGSPALDGPNWLNDPTLALGFSMLVHIWKSLPFWTLILVAGRLAIPGRSSTRPRRSTAPASGRSSASSPGRR